MCFTIPLYLLYCGSQDAFPILGRNGRLNQAWFPFWARNGVWVLRVSSERGPVVKMWGLPFDQSYLELALSILEARIRFPIYAIGERQEASPMSTKITKSLFIRQSMCISVKASWRTVILALFSPEMIASETSQHERFNIITFCPPLYSNTSVCLYFPKS